MLTEKINVLSLWQPYATLLAYQLKLNETRPSHTNHLGTYLIHAAQKKDKFVREICSQEPFKSALHSIGVDSYQDLPYGALVGAWEVERCRQVPKDEYQETLKTEYPSIYFNIDDMNEWEWAFGNYGPGRCIWEGSGHRALQQAVPYKGAQGYYVPFKGDYSQLKFL